MNNDYNKIVNEKCYWRTKVRKLRKVLIGITIVMTVMMLSSCGVRKNEDFDYMTERSIMKVSIQSTRDESYKFIVTDKDVINDIYTILSKGMVVDEKSSMDPDYTLEIYESPTEVKSFSYIAGLDKKSGGNLYDNGHQYIISNRLDNDIIKNFTNIRMPLSFDSMYYSSILKAIDSYESGNKDHGSIGVRICKDRMVLKFQLSTQIEAFESSLDKRKNTSLIKKNDDTDKVDTLLTVETTGYTTKKFKAIVTAENKADGATSKYYINNVYENGGWIINVTDTEPDGF